MPVPELSPHEEVLAALHEAAVASGVPTGHGARVQADRGSSLIHLGLRTPVRRKRVRQGFSFTDTAAAETLAAWDEVWRGADVADVMFAPLDHYRERPIGEVDGFWPVVSQWVERVENWAHADDLARVYSRALEADIDLVYPTLLEWSGRADEWHRRISMVSLIHYSGPNAAFMPTGMVLDLVANAVDDQRPTVSKAVGWVLRETRKADEGVVGQFIDEHAPVMAADARRRANDGRAKG